jgi:hypothetical protein
LKRFSPALPTSRTCWHRAGSLHHDAVQRSGSKTGFVEATLSLALERPDMANEVRAIMERLLAGG